jgi:hypothetical protein
MLHGSLELISQDACLGLYQKNQFGLIKKDESTPIWINQKRREHTCPPRKMWS